MTQKLHDGDHFETTLMPAHSVKNIWKIFKSNGMYPILMLAFLGRPAEEQLS